MISQEQTQDLANSWYDFLQSCHTHHTHMMGEFLSDMGVYNPFLIQTPALGDAFGKALQNLSTDPSQLLQTQGELMEEMQLLWEKLASLGTSDILPPTSDKRFRHEAWETVPYYLFIKEYYLMMSRWLERNVSQLKDLDEKTTQKIRFYTKQVIEAASPTNSPFTNPEVLEEFVKTKGQSLTRGFETLLQDMSKGQWMKMTDPSAFQIGETIASTKGEVVYRNHLFELIHYAPCTKKQYATPLLIIPPWINKYYIFDLSPSNSFVKWVEEQGHNVFIMSWVNPESTLSPMNFEDYLIDGAYRACEVITTLTKSPTLNTMGYCVGGNLLTALNAYLAKSPAPFSIQTMALLATVIDFDQMGDLRIFADEDYLQQVEKMMAQNGFLNGEELKALFSLLRPNDLVWSFFIKNYFLGQVPPAFDFLYWNSDSIRLPEGLHRFVLRHFFQKNLFMKPNGISIKGIPLDVRDITTPAFLLSTLEDHISPWKSTYPAVHLFKGPVEFILAGSGHVAGVINPPSKNKYGFYTNTLFPEEGDQWLNTATQHEGSWWTMWNDWTTSFGKKKISPLTDYPILQAAPGSYVSAL